ncbi:basic-leucine zipper transcription factor A [Prunus avium]|uniref:Basic-leucine zipper transcription factor A n=1 Tax=Prunus avium TaxID=42229 RepID=A0A6P5S6A8_PRUAV|nr:basic-leucine zipper transcription factor A [Prunus avium]
MMEPLNEHEPCSPSSLKQKLRSSLCIIPCFPKTTPHHHSITAPTTPHAHSANVSLVRNSSFSSSSKSRSSHHHHHHHHNHHPHHHGHHNSHYEFAELKDKCKSLIGRMGRSHTARRHSASADFKYDALSYALNFDHEEANIEDYPFRSFSARLPPSPPRTSQDSAASPSASKEITACS